MWTGGRGGRAAAGAAGIEVVVLEKHSDFLCDFGGDTIHASTLTPLDELGLNEDFARMPHQRVETLGVTTSVGSA